MRYSNVLKRLVPQTQKLNPNQVQNDAGGFGYAVTDWARLDRFLLLGTCGGTYYATERRLTLESADAVVRCIREDGERVVRRIAEIDSAGRAPKKSAATFALALCIKEGDEKTRAAAYLAIHRVCRTASHLFELVSELDGLGKGWSRGLRNAVASWYTSKSDDKLGYQLIKYGARAGYSHKDLLRLTHPKSDSAVLRWIVKGGIAPTEQMEAAERLKSASVRDAVELIVGHRLPRECVPTALLNEPAVWEALLAEMPMTAMIRNLGKMTSVGLIVDGSHAAAKVVDALSEFDRLKSARVHPLSLLVALKVYSMGYGLKGSLKWDPVSRVSNALNDAITLSFGAIEETKRRELIAIDVSGSMNYRMMEFGGLLLHEAAACMALASIAANPSASVVVFDTTWKSFDAHGRRWDDLARALANFGGGTDLCQAIYAAQNSAIKPDLVSIYTDNETWAGRQHPEQAWHTYKNVQPNARCVVASMTAAGTVAMPSSEDVLQVVGFDAALPEVISAFAE